MKQRIIDLLEERIDNKYEQIWYLQRDKAMYQYNARFGSFQSASEDALRRANRGIKTLRKDIERLERMVEWLQ